MGSPLPASPLLNLITGAWLTQICFEAPSVHSKASAMVTEVSNSPGCTPTSPPTPPIIGAPMATPAVSRAGTAPVAMLLYSLVVLWFASNGHRVYQAPNRPWYRSKTRASFADMLATLRCQSLEEHVSSYLLSGRGSRKVIEMLLQAVQRAA